jgi:hypothetical protein
MRPDRDLANDIVLGMTTLVLENTFLKAFLSKLDREQIEKALANTKTDLTTIRGALQSIAPLHAELNDADSLKQLAKKYVEMHIHLSLSDDLN